MLKAERKNMDSNIAVQIITIVVLLVFSAYFSATETAFTSLNRIKMKNLASEGNKKAQLVLELEASYDELLTTILIGNNLVNIAMTAVATVLFISLYGSYGPTVATVVITVVVLIFGEISPKSIAKESSENFALRVAPSVRIIMVILTPVNFLFVKWKAFLSRIFKLENESGISEDELMTIVEEAETCGGIDSEQSELIQNAIEFNSLSAEEVMTPRVDIVAVDIDEITKEELGKIFAESGFSRLPVYEGDLDRISGVINQKDFHNHIAGGCEAIADYVKPVVFVAETMKIAALLKKMQQMKTHMAVIIDEYGGTEGLVTMEDIMEELVGEIFDEHDAVISQEIIPLPNGSYRVSGSANINKIFDYFDVDEETGIVNTVNGWVTYCLDKIPEVGDRFECSIQNRIFKGRVVRAGERKADVVILSVENEKNEETELKDK